MQSNIFVTWTPIIISSLAMFISYRANVNNKELAKENFRNILIDKLKSAKYMILKLEIKEYEHQEKMLLTESINNHLLYQQNGKEKDKYLTKEEQDKLSNLQENIEDYVALLINDTDVKDNRNLAINTIKEYLKNL